MNIKKLENYQSDLFDFYPLKGKLSAFAIGAVLKDQIKKQKDNNAIDVLVDFLEDNFRKVKIQNNFYAYGVKIKAYDEFIKTCHEILQDPDSSMMDLEETDSSGSDSDNELIQQVLARRMKRDTTSKKSIIDNDLDDSDMEDVVSISRRYRWLKHKLSTLENRLSILENNNLRT